MHIEKRYVRVLNDLSVLDHSSTPHNKLAMQSPLAVQDMEKTMGVLTCATQRKLIFSGNAPWIRDAQIFTGVTNLVLE